MKFLTYIGVVFATLILLVGICFLPIWDQATISDDGLQHATTDIPDSENLQATLTSITQRLSTSTRVNLSDLVKIKEISLTNTEHLQLIASTEKLMEAYLADSQKASFHCVDAHTTCPLGLTRDIGLALALHAEYHTLRKNTNKADQLLQAGLNLSSALSSDPSLSTIQLLLAVAIGNFQLQIIEKYPVLRRPTSAAPIPLTAVRSSLIDEYGFFKATILQKSDVAVSYWQQPNRTINEMADFTKSSIEIGTTACDQVLSPETVARLDAIVQKKKSYASQPWRPNWLGSAQQSIWLTSLAPTLRTQVCDFNVRLEELKSL